jgi:LacI family transcriptional regulator
MQRVTLKEVANGLNISVSTVSRALADHPRISDSTKALVRRTVHELTQDRITKTGLHSIGMYLTNAHQDELFMKIVAGVTHYADGIGANTLIENLAGEGDVVPYSLVRNQADGMIVGGVPLADEMVEALCQRDIPTVFIGRYLQPEQSAALNAVIPDNISGGRKAARHLIDCGYERFVVVWPSEPCNPHIDRMNGFMEVISERHHHVTTVIYPSAKVNIVPGVLDVINVIAKKHSVGVFVMNDIQAITVLQALLTARIDVPGQVGVIGYNGIDAGATTLPTLTTIDVPKETLGFTAAHMLNDIVTGTILAPVQLYLQPKVLHRGSTRGFPG